jgi:hypothetical protein
MIAFLFTYKNSAEQWNDMDTENNDTQ